MRSISRAKLPPGGVRGVGVSTPRGVVVGAAGLGDKEDEERCWRQVCGYLAEFEGDEDDEGVYVRVGELKGDKEGMGWLVRRR